MTQGCAMWTWGHVTEWGVCTHVCLITHQSWLVRLPRCTHNNSKVSSGAIFFFFIWKWWCCSSSSSISYKRDSKRKLDLFLRNQPAHTFTAHTPITSCSAHLLHFTGSTNHRVTVKHYIQTNSVLLFLNSCNKLSRQWISSCLTSFTGLKDKYTVSQMCLRTTIRSSAEH